MIQLHVANCLRAFCLVNSHHFGYSHISLWEITLAKDVRRLIANERNEGMKERKE